VLLSATLHQVVNHWSVGCVAGNRLYIAHTLFCCIVKDNDMLLTAIRNLNPTVAQSPDGIPALLGTIIPIPLPKGTTMGSVFPGKTIRPLCFWLGSGNEI
jgi:hypothetical protein